MRKHWFRSIGLGGLSAMGLVLGLQQAASAADKKIEIVRKAGRFVFAEPNVTINVGQSVEWWGTDRPPISWMGIPHLNLRRSSRLPELRPRHSTQPAS